GRQPITFTFRWLRCDTAGNNCIVQQGFQDDAYVLREGDVGKTIRARVIARNSSGDASRLTAPSPTVQGPQTPPGPAGVITLPNGEKSIPVTSVPSDQRLVVDQVQFSPNPIRSRTEPITVRVKVKDTRGYVVRDALVFLRSTPLVTRNAQDQKTGQDGWLQLTVTPERDFPQLRPAYSVQFFVKAFRQGDPELAGVAGYRLVQVPLGLDAAGVRPAIGRTPIRPVRPRRGNPQTSGAVMHSARTGSHRRRAALSAVSLVALVLAVGAGARGSAGPVNTADPTITGVALVGRTVETSNGSWTKPSSGLTYKYQWLRCNPSGGDDSSDKTCTAISGATRQSYTIVSG